jgi:hypothetical protein
MATSINSYEQKLSKNNPPKYNFIFDTVDNIDDSQEESKVQFNDNFD